MPALRSRRFCVPGDGNRRIFYEVNNYSDTLKNILRGIV